VRPCIATFSISVVAVLCVGCPTDPDPGETDAGPRPDGAAGGHIEIGTGAVVFAPMADGAPWELVAGPQGGWHLEVSVALYGLEPEGLDLSYEIRTESGAVLTMPLTYALTRRRVLEEPGRFVRLGDRAIFDIGAPEEVVGLGVVVEASALTPEGIVHTDARRATVVDEE